MNIIAIVDYIGTFVFAISGIRLAAAKEFDWFGAFVIGLVTAVGGGTIRDVLLNNTPFWMLEFNYVIITASALIVVIVFGRKLIHFYETIFIFVAIGLGLFTVVGIEKSIQAGFPMWVSIFMGTITGAAGGVLRDILINEEPLIFRKDIYAIACVIGGFVFFCCKSFNFPHELTIALTSFSIITIRVIAVKYHINLPTLKGWGDIKE